jgi:serine/threonine-protein kinase RsbW
MFVVTRELDRVEMLFSATLENIDRAVEESRAFLSTMGEAKCPFEIVLIMREALSNAVLHGCAQDPDKTVRYSLQIEDKDLVIDVEDQGEGFDWRAAVHRAILPSIQHEHGRGLVIMSKYGANVLYNDKGNRLTVTKRLRS